MSISSRYLTLQPSYYIDLNEGHEEIYHQHQMIHNHTTPFSFSSLQPHHNVSSLSSSSSSSSPNYLKPVQDQAGFCYMGSQIQPYSCQQEVENLRSYGSGSHDQTTLEINKRANNGLTFSICKKEDKSFSVGYGGDCGGSSTGEINGSSVKWMSSKMRLMKKMMKNEEDQRAEADNRVGNSLVIKSSNNGSSNNNNNNENVTIRTCSDCNTTKTPLWRSGPRGPKSLCNACGIRQRKARRAAMAAATGNGSMLPINPSSSMIRTGNNKKTPVNNNGFGTQKKRSKMAKPSRDQHNHNDSQRKLCFEEFALSLSKKLSIQQVFPQEEKEAAILLMALSCGLVHG